MKKHFVTGGLLAFLFAASACTVTHNEGAATAAGFCLPRWDGAPGIHIM